MELGTSALDWAAHVMRIYGQEPLLNLLTPPAALPSSSRDTRLRQQERHVSDDAGEHHEHLDAGCSRQAGRKMATSSGATN